MGESSQTKSDELWGLRRERRTQLLIYCVNLKYKCSIITSQYLSCQQHPQGQHGITYKHKPNTHHNPPNTQKTTPTHQTHNTNNSTRDANFNSESQDIRFGEDDSLNRYNKDNQYKGLSGDYKTNPSRKLTQDYKLSQDYRLNEDYKPSEDCRPSEDYKANVEFGQAAVERQRQRTELSLVEEILREQPFEERDQSTHPSTSILSRDQLKQKLRLVERHIQEKEQPHPKPEVQISGPSNEQLQTCLQIVSKEFPNYDIGFIIARLHQYLTHFCQPNKDAPHGNSNVIKVNSKDEVLIANYFTPAVMRSNDEKRIALSFLNYGYGLKILREVIKDESITPTKYNNIITTIVKNTFRTIESTVRQLNKPIVEVGPREERILRAPLVNCEKWLPKEELETFYKLVRGSSGLEEVSVSSHCACKLYSLILKQLQQRKEREGRSNGKSEYDEVDHPSHEIQ